MTDITKIARIIDNEAWKAIEDGRDALKGSLWGYRRDSAMIRASEIIAALSRPIDPKAEVAGWFNRPTDDGVYHQVAKEFEGSAGTVPLYRSASPSVIAPVVVPEGWQLVPKEPTHEILSTLSDDRYDVEPGGKANWTLTWNALLAAAPALTPAEKAGVGDEAAEADRRKHVGQGMAIAAAIIVRVWGDDTQAKEILGAAGYKSVADLKRDEIDDYDIEPLAPLLAAQGDDAQEGTKTWGEWERKQQESDR